MSVYIVTVPTTDIPLSIVLVYLIVMYGHTIVRESNLWACLTATTVLRGKTLLYLVAGVIDCNGNILILLLLLLHLATYHIYCTNVLPNRW